MVKEKCEFCNTETTCNFGMMGKDIRLFFCSVDCMVGYAQVHGYHPYNGLINVIEK